ncbi:MAG: redoxin domain-containing protein [Candidatus Thermoplasmatota archaeon]|nr:redoxin domain-containing protein [Candidatus Thermoplasmatota archaeon]
MDEKQRLIALALALAAITATIVYIEAPWREGSTVPEAPEEIPPELLEYPGAPNFEGATGWINTAEPVDLVEQRGNVVLVDFWTYSCINCINTFPYLRAWHDAYADDGLVIVGVHTPEFRFEREAENVQEATERYQLPWAMAQDNDYEIWEAYHNRYWPAKYLIDQYGRIRYTHFGEGAYEETEDKIRELLVEAGHEPGPRAQVNATGGGVLRGQTPELFASHLDGRKHHAIGNEEGYHPGETITYAPPQKVENDKIYLTGTWANTGQYVEAVGENATVTLSFQAGGMNFVANDNNGTCAFALLDGRPIPPELSGPDVEQRDGRTCIVLDQDRAFDTYAGPFERHLLELQVPDGFQLYSFAFSFEGREG